MNASPISISHSPGLAFPRIAGGAVAIVGGVVLAGWALGIHALTDPVPGTATMKANTALAFILCGGAMSLLHLPGARAWRAVRVGALAAGGLALLTLAEYATGWNPGLDELLFRDTGTVATSHPGRMGPNTAICFALTAAALWLMGRPAGKARRPLILGWLGALVGAIGFFAVLGYVVGFSFGYGWGSLTAMAVHTAPLFMLLGAAVFAFAWREARVRWLLGRWATAGFACALALLVGIAAFSQRSAKELVDAAEQVVRTHEVIRRITELRADLEEEQSGVRGFVIAGDEAFLPLYTNAILAARKDLRELRELTADNASQRAQLAVLEQVIDERLENSRRMIELRRIKGFDEAEHRVATGRGKALSDQIRARLGGMAADEERRLAARRAQSVATTERTLAVLPVGVLLGVLLLTFAVVRLNGEAAARQRGAEALRLSELRLRLTLEAADIGDWELDLVTHAARRSLKHDQIFGYPELLPEWSYELFLTHVHPEDRARVDHAFQESVAAGRDWAFECRIIRHDGTPGWIWARGGAVRDGSGQLVEMLGMVGDMTERKQAQESLRESEERLQRALAAEHLAIERQQAADEIRQLNASLEQRVGERTAQLEAAVRELDAFSYSVSHDLRAPLRAVDGFSRMVAEDNAARLDDEGRRMLGVIRSETQRMGRLIDDLLAFSRLGRQQLEPGPMDMHGLAQEVFDELAAHDPARRLRLDLHPLPPARGAQAMIRQVWVNLIGNAIKFTKERAVGEIEIGAREGGEGGPIYYVKDNGAGFDMRFAGKLFGVFQRLHGQQEFSGTGVGLALVQRIVQRHGGRVWAEGEVGRGATFFFAFPNQKL